MKEALPVAHQRHVTKHRLRIGVPGKKADGSFFHRVEAAFADCPGVTHTRGNPLTESILFEHSTTVSEIAKFAVRKGLFVLKRPSSSRGSLFNAVAETFEQWNESLKKSSGGDLDIPSVVFLSLVASGFYQLLRGNITIPAWYTAFYYAAGVFPKAKVEAPDEGAWEEDGEGDADGGFDMDGFEGDE
jgi:hypothetical protein